MLLPVHIFLMTSFGAELRGSRAEPQLTPLSAPSVK
ncbi:hypothetical protein LINPERHAP1_LOCUS38750, partial [Linum perenne]